MLRQGKPTDFEAIVGIRESVALDIGLLDDPAYKAQVQQAGFLLPTALSREVFEADLPGYTVAEERGKVMGYLCLHDYQSWEPDQAGKIDWLRPDVQDAYFAEPHAYIWGVAVDPGVQKHGTATSLLIEAEKQTQARRVPWLFSMIVTSPVTNVASLLFHERHGFERIAQTRPAYDAGLDGFVNLLYGKQCQGIY